ncbi:hypothetical protein HX099_09475 [Thiopseudomonas alkaliphila]|uniref:Lipoprotein n=1 Tax=Thiopseudomonas alkaliphila TaxID=1697053 RepID=A0AAW7DRW0_9GAMM|nr:hypothetical protein [Thiopseudomonas alkaliphila]MDM1696885.1 hypothetical protein [Thiopseudomonas alkaliphila]
MKQFMVRSIALSGMCVFLMACQGVAQQTAQEQQEMQFAISAQVFEQYLQADNLPFAAEQLDEMQSAGLSGTALELYQQQLAEAWLAKSKHALEQHDMQQAATALANARKWLPDAPALAAELPEAVIEPAPPEPVVPPVKALPKPAVKAKPAPKAQAPAEPAAVAPSARSLTVVKSIALPMQDNLRLGSTLEQAAKQAIDGRYQIAVQVQDTKEFHWVAALLNTRFKRLSATFNPQLIERIAVDQAPLLQLLSAE